MTGRVLVTCRLPGDGLTRLAQVAEVDVLDGVRPVPREELLARAVGVHGIITTVAEQIDRAVLDAAGPQLTVVSTVSAGTDHIDVAACTQAGIAVGHTPGVLTEPTAELAIALMLATSRRLLEAAAAVRSGQWPTWEPTWMCGRDLSGAVLGIVGYGAIGQAVARRAPALGLTVQFTSRGDTGTGLDELLATSDIVSLHCPLTPQTKGLIGARALSVMKSDAILINTARGAVVDEDALVHALRTGQIRAAGLDVTAQEPLPVDSPLLDLPNCVVLPHVGSATTRTRTVMADLAVANVQAALAGEPLPFSVNGPTGPGAVAPG